ncbi:MAG: alpha/beta fold hydrolase [Candidatus Eremiobacteraeota bacterium]|nr:alpha/beta fold hydrolase [Candidatus Eremiobacteraeota bacterium]
MNDTIVTEADRALARAMLQPAKREPRASIVRWDRSETVAGRYGPIAVWTTGAGATAAPPAVVLVHGWETDHVDMDAFVAPLVAAGRRAIAFDLPAHGETHGDTATLPDLAGALADVDEAAGGVTAIVAHSVGCAATAIALAGGLRAERVAFVAPPLRYEHFVRVVAQQNGRDGDAVVAALGELGLDVAPLDIRSNAATIDVPLLIVHSTDDRVCAASNATKIAAVWRGARAELVDGLGHARILRDANVVRRVVRFIAGETLAD